MGASAPDMMRAEAAAFDNQLPAYREDPMRETLRAVEGLVAEAGYERQTITPDMIRDQ